MRRAIWMGLAIMIAVIVARGSVAHAQCTIEGTLSLPRVRVMSLAGRAPRFVALENVAAVVRPIRHGLVEIESTLPDGRRFVGQSRTEPRYEVREHVSLPGLELGAGIPVLDLRPLEGDLAELDLLLAEGIVLRQVRVPCSALTFVGERPRTTDLAFPRELAAPRLTPRTRDLHLRVAPGDDRSSFLRLRFTDRLSVVLFEVDRRESQRTVVLSLVHARLTGVVDLTNVMPVTEALTEHRRWVRPPRP
jgi:hypothetical protein